MNKAFLAVAVIAALSSMPALAGFPLPPTYPATMVTTGPNSKTETKAYAGLKWTLGGGFTPSVVLGATNTKVKVDGDTTGANLSFQLDVFGGFKPGALKLSYLNGKNTGQGELGVGYHFSKGQPLLGLGLRGPYVAAGIDGYLGSGLEPYVMLHSQDKFKKPKQGQKATCLPGDALLFPDTCQDL